MKNYTVTVNGTAYDVTVEDKGLQLQRQRQLPPRPLPGQPHPQAGQAL